MAQFIVISEENKNRLMDRKSEFNSEISSFNCDLEPIQIKSGEFILPLIVLSHPAFESLKNRIISDGNESLITIREVLSNEFIRDENFI